MSEFELGEIEFTGGLPDEKPEKDLPKDPPRKGSNRGPGRPSNESKIDDVRREIQQLIKFGVMPIKFRDIHEDGSSCADIFVYYDDKKKKTELTQQGLDLAEALTDIVWESPFLMKILNSGDAFGKWGRLAVALYPIGSSIYAAHGGRRELEYDSGEGSVA